MLKTNIHDHEVYRIKLDEIRRLVETLGVEVVGEFVQSRRRPFTQLDDFLRLGIQPMDYDVIVVKLGYLFPELRDFAPRHIMAMSPGFGDQRIDRLPFTRLTRPIYPLDLDARYPD